MCAWGARSETKGSRGPDSWPTRRRMRWRAVTAAPLAVVSVRATTTPGVARLLQEALVVAHHQLCLELFHRVEGDADDDQDRGAAEEEVGRGLVDEDGRQGG